MERSVSMCIAVLPARVRAAEVSKSTVSGKRTKARAGTATFFVKQQRLVGSYGRNAADLKATLEWAAAGKLRPTIDRVFPLEKTGEAFARLRSRNALGKLIVKPSRSS